MTDLTVPLHCIGKDAEQLDGLLSAVGCLARDGAARSDTFFCEFNAIEAVVKSSRLVLDGMVAGLGRVAEAAQPASGAPDPMVALWAKATALRTIAEAPGPAATRERAAQDLGDLDHRVRHARPTTIDGAVAALTWARMEVVDAAGGELERGDRVILDLLDHALGVLGAPQASHRSELRQ